MSQHNLPTTATTDLDSVKNHFKNFFDDKSLFLLLAHIYCCL
jgi:hypothetical protein